MNNGDLFTELSDIKMAIATVDGKVDVLQATVTPVIKQVNKNKDAIFGVDGINTRLSKNSVLLGLIGVAIAGIGYRVISTWITGGG